jgi:hypothetical protein
MKVVRRETVRILSTSEEDGVEAPLARSATTIEQ